MQKKSKKKALTAKEKKEIQQEKQEQILFQEVDERTLGAEPIKERELQIEELEEKVGDLQEELNLDNKTLADITSDTILEEISQEELSQFVELQNMSKFLLEIKEDLSRLITPTNELFLLIKENASNKDELNLLIQKVILLKGVKENLLADRLLAPFTK